MTIVFQNDEVLYNVSLIKTSYAKGCTHAALDNFGKYTGFDITQIKEVRG